VGGLTIYHNPRCSKSREALALLEARGAAPRVVRYLEAPPSAAELAAILRKLGIRPEQLVRKAEGVFKAKYAGAALTDAGWIEAMVNDPILMERPIIVKGARAVIGRPPERALALLDN
jgi:arsenate reductase